MAQNKICDGVTMNYENETESVVYSEDPVLVGSVLGVAMGDIPPGGVGVLGVCGVWRLPKVTGSMAQGATLYWDAAGDPVGGTAGTGALTTDSASNANPIVGFAWEAATSADTVVFIKLC